MNQNNNFPRYGQQGPQQYGLSSFDAPRGKQGFIARVFGDGIAQKFSNPLFSTAVFVLGAVLFAGIIVAAYPDGESDGEVPVVRANTLAFKETPAEAGGMDIPNRDSTIFAAMNNENTSEPAPIENLLEDDQPMDKLAAFAREVEADVESGAESAADTAEDAAQDISTMASAASANVKDAVDGAEETAPIEIQKIEMKKVEPPQQLASASTSEAESTTTAERPAIVHKAGENPETLDFVRSVLDKKDAGETASEVAASDVATRAASVEPASGAPADFTIAPGSYYVQLGSVKSLDGASGEWGKLKKEYSAELGASPHRVQAADLGDRGTFYRIQAGPMSKDSASKICDSIKSQKPGGCLVVQ